MNTAGDQVFGEPSETRIIEPEVPVQRRNHRGHDAAPRLVRTIQRHLLIKPVE